MQCELTKAKYLEIDRLVRTGPISAKIRVTMPELFVVHEFQRRCQAAIGQLHVSCEIYFNPQDFRKGKMAMMYNYIQDL